MMRRDVNVVSTGTTHHDVLPCCYYTGTAANDDKPRVARGTAAHNEHYTRHSSTTPPLDVEHRHTW